LFFDLTISLSKSISIFHASLGENVRLAREADDVAGERYWSGLVAEVDAMIWRAVRAGFDYFQREAGYTRTAAGRLAGCGWLRNGAYRESSSSSAAARNASRRAVRSAAFRSGRPTSLSMSPGRQ
jgi:hypothetical protein